METARTWKHNAVSAKFRLDSRFYNTSLFLRVSSGLSKKAGKDHHYRGSLPPTIFRSVAPAQLNQLAGGFQFNLTTTLKQQQFFICVLYIKFCSTAQHSVIQKILCQTSSKYGYMFKVEESITGLWYLRYGDLMYEYRWVQYDEKRVLLYIQIQY